MSLTDDLTQLTEVSKCSACAWMETRTEKERAKLASTLAWIKSGSGGRFTDLMHLCETHGMAKMTPQAFRHHVHSHVAD